MSPNNNKNQYKEAFDRAKDRYRQVGVGGISSTPHQPGEVDSKKQDPKKNIKVNPDGTVVIGGPNVKTTKSRPNLGVHVFDYGESKKD